MKKSHLRLLLGLVLLLGLALIAASCSCRTPAPTGGPGPAEPVKPRRVLGHTPEANHVCPPQKVAGAGGYWQFKNVFEPLPGEDLPPSMADLCAGDWISEPSGAQSPPDFGVLQGGPLSAYTPELPIVATMGSTVPLSLAQLRDDFLQEVEALLPAPSAAPQVILGIADSSPSSSDGNITKGKDPHGFNIGWIAKHLTCPAAPGEGCIGYPVMALALDRESPSSGPDGNKGGSYGYPSQLAAAIHGIVNVWKQTPAMKHLVINLSVGWEPKFECEHVSIPGLIGRRIDLDLDGDGTIDNPHFVTPVPPCSNPAPEAGRASVYMAIREAACAGALVIAAAGNDMGYTPPLQDPIYPAIWAGESVTCDGDVAPPSRLLYAVGGVGPTDVRISISRAGGRPRLAAPASLAVAFPGSEPLEGSYYLTGTSVAAAVASGIAATVWAYRPDLTAAQVMDFLYTSGESLAEKADFCAGAPCDAIHRVSMRSAVCHACKGPLPQGAACPALPPICVPTLLPDDPSDDPILVLDIPELPRPNVPFPVQLLGLTYGQPTRPACPDCKVTLTAQGNNVIIWEVTGLLDPLFFSENSVAKLEAPKVALSSAMGAPLGTSSLSEQTVLYSAPWSAHPVSGSGTTAQQPTTATITWTQTTNLGAVSVLTQQIPVR